MRRSGGRWEAEKEKEEIGDEKRQRGEGRDVKRYICGTVASSMMDAGQREKRSADGEGDTGVVFWTDIFSALSKCSPATR